MEGKYTETVNEWNSDNSLGPKLSTSFVAQTLENYLLTI